MAEVWLVLLVNLIVILILAWQLVHCSFENTKSIFVSIISHTGEFNDPLLLWKRFINNTLLRTKFSLCLLNIQFPRTPPTPLLPPILMFYRDQEKLREREREGRKPFYCNAEFLPSCHWPKKFLGNYLKRQAQASPSPPSSPRGNFSFRTTLNLIMFMCLCVRVCVYCTCVCVQLNMKEDTPTHFQTEYKLAIKPHQMNCLNWKSLRVKQIWQLMYN